MTLLFAIRTCRSKLSYFIHSFSPPPSKECLFPINSRPPVNLVGIVSWSINWGLAIFLGSLDLGVNLQISTRGIQNMSRFLQKNENLTHGPDNCGQWFGMVMYFQHIESTQKWRVINQMKRWARRELVTFSDSTLGIRYYSLLFSPQEVLALPHILIHLIQFLYIF